MKMKTTLSLVAVAAVALFSHGAFAQEKSRAEVKAETKLPPTGAGQDHHGDLTLRSRSPSRPRTAPK